MTYAHTHTRRHRENVEARREGERERVKGMAGLCQGTPWSTIIHYIQSSLVVVVVSLAVTDE